MIQAAARYFKTVGDHSLALAEGLAVTFRQLFRKPVTVQYPEEKAPLAERFRGMLNFDIDTCIACDMCVRACPSSCIHLVSFRNAAGKKEIQTYTIDFGKCNWCRLCEEACPTKPLSVYHTLEYELTFHSRDDFKITWKKDADGKPLLPVNAANVPIGPWSEGKEVRRGPLRPAAAAAAH